MPSSTGVLVLSVGGYARRTTARGGVGAGGTARKALHPLRSAPKGPSRKPAPLTTMMMSAARRFGARGSGRNGERAGLLGATGAGSSLGDDLESPSSSSASAAVTCAFAASLSALCFGYHMAAINGCLEAIAGANNLVAQGLVVSTLLVGAAVGSFFAGRVADAFGRRRGLQYTGLLLVLGPSICVALSSSLALILAGRFVTGLGVGLASSLCPLYISETAPKHLRGSLGSVNQLTICAGIFFGLASNLVYADWRPIFVWGAVPAGILVALAEWVLPESPRHLAATGRREEARKVALGLWGDSIEAREEASGVVAEAAMADKEAAGSLSAAPEDASILHPKYRKILAASVLMFVFQQMSGINSIVFFSSSIFHAIGVPSAALASLIVGMVNFFGTLLTW